MWTRAKRLDPIALFYALAAILLGIFGVFEVVRAAQPALAFLGLGCAFALAGCAIAIELALAKLGGARR